MDIQAVASQLMNYIGNNPDLIAQFAEHPYSTTAAATGSKEKISKKEMSQIATQVAAQSAGKPVGMGDLSGIAASLLGQNGGSVHALTGALFGGASAEGVASMAEIAMKSAIGGAVAKGAGTLIANAIGGKKPKA